MNEKFSNSFSLETTKIFNVSQLEIRDMLKYLGHMYVFDVDEGEIEEVQFLHAILSRAYGDYSIDWLMMQVYIHAHFIYIRSIVSCTFVSLFFFLRFVVWKIFMRNEGWKLIYC